MADISGWISLNPVNESFPPAGLDDPANYSSSNSGVVDDSFTGSYSWYFGVNYDVDGVFLWTPVWTPVTPSDPIPPIDFPFGADTAFGRIYFGFANTYTPGLLELTCTKDGTPVPGIVTITFAEGGVYGDAAWLTVADTVAFSGSPREGPIFLGMGTSSGVVDPDNVVPLTGPIRFSQLPIADRVYENDMIMLHQGEPPVTRIVTVIEMLSATTSAVASNSEVQGTPRSKLMSQLAVGAEVSTEDWIIIQQGDPPVTRKTHPPAMIMRLYDTFNGAAGIVADHEPDVHPNGFVWLDNSPLDNLTLDGSGDLVNLVAAQAVAESDPLYFVLPASYSVILNATVGSSGGFASSATLSVTDLDSANFFNIQVHRFNTGLFSVEFNSTTANDSIAVDIPAGTHEYVANVSSTSVVLTMDGDELFTVEADVGMYTSKFRVVAVTLNNGVPADPPSIQSIAINYP